jgi:hypothetical protein
MKSEALKRGMPSGPRGDLARIQIHNVGSDKPAFLLLVSRLLN